MQSLSDHFGYGGLLKFILPSVVMMVFTSIYGVVDGLFVSNFVGKTAFAAINLIMPLLIILGAVGFMLGTGGSAVVAKTMGMREGELANRYFSCIIITTVASGVVLSALGIAFAEPIARLLGAEGELLSDCVLYARVVLLALPAFMLQNVFQAFFITAERPKLGLLFTVGAGVTNMVLDALLVAVIPMGLLGAALATAISQAVGGLLPIFYFLSRKNASALRLCKTRFFGKMLLRASANGSSELLSNVSMSVVTMLYNNQLMKFAGENGIAAYGAIMYVAFIFASIFIGFSIGSSPTVSYHFGAGNTGELRSLRKKSLVIVGVGGVLMCLTAYLLSSPLSHLFVGYDAALCALTEHGFRIFSLSFIFSGFNIFASGFFTALNDGLRSAIISFARTVIFQCGTVTVMPIFFELEGVWWSVVASDVLAFCVGLIFLIAMRKRYNY
ncbi:MAG: MATE family efflux transporter [Clostridia bacterium]|nr:MATE family efflux transporter [Clostridia bacterium]